MRLACSLLLPILLCAQPAKPPAEPAPIQKKHTITIAGKTLQYTTTTGRLPLLNEAGDPEAFLFFVAYTLDNPSPATKRPLMVAFNGGPGSASVWLHLGVLGPRYIPMLDDGSYPPPPYQVKDNPHTFLPFTDMVFVDPVGTGYSRAAKPELGKKFWGVQGDIASVGEFIRLYLGKYNRWSSPLYLTGESYGTFRAAGLAGWLVDRGMACNGIVLVSSILQYQTARFDRGNDLPYPLFLPTYTAIAWYHKKLPSSLQQAGLKEATAEAEKFALNEYAVALMKGDRLTPAERQATLDKLSRLTGLSKEYLERNNLRPKIMQFIKELRRSEGKVVGRLDGRLTATEGNDGEEMPGFDPSMTAIRAPYTAAFNDYARRELGYESDLHYYILGGGIGPWDYGSGGQNKYVETADSLRDAFAKNPYMKVYIGSGYYDLATPYFATDYTFSHMGLPAAYKKNITTRMYEAGHMFYSVKGALEQLSKDVEAMVTGVP
jgi:carboxypeptidase C (cathepsin A)